MEKLYQSIGEFEVEFSKLIHHMEFMTVLTISNNADSNVYEKLLKINAPNEIEPISQNS